MRNQLEGVQSAENDPFALTSGRIIYEKAYNVNIFINEKPGVMEKLPLQEELKIKIAVKEDLANISLICMELSSDKELDFNFQFRCNEAEFRRIREIQKFYINFREYHEAIIRNLEKVDQKGQQPHVYQVNFIIFSEKQGKLEIIRRSEFKDDQIMEFEFKRSPEEHIHASVQYRFDEMRKQFCNKVAKYEDYRQIIKAKNPSLMMQIDKSLKLRK